MERVCLYLRKSRADLEAEARGEGETLTKHRRQLIAVAKKKNINIIKIREELVSGERIIDRPEVTELLYEVEAGAYDAVLVMDIDRLGRGDMVDQGTILRAFKVSKTKIITPNKVYDLENEWDEEYTEFEAFMARRELKMITRRMQRGRIQSVKEGNYIGTHPPYGYQIKKTDRERILVPHPEQADVVRMIYDWYTHDIPTKRMGGNKIANELNRLGYSSYTGKRWSAASVLNILKNVVYIGRLQWRKKETKKSTDPSKTRETRTRPQEFWIDVQGKHEPLIPIEVFQKAQDILQRKYHVPYISQSGMTNPLAGLVKCGLCGSSMVYRPYTKQKPHLICYMSNCQNKSSRYEFVEQSLLYGLKEWLQEYKAEWMKHKRSETSLSTTRTMQATLKNIKRELNDLEVQLERLYDFLERGIYSEKIFLDRSKSLIERINKRKAAHTAAQQDLQLELTKLRDKQETTPKFEHILDLYSQTDDPSHKNNLLKSILDKVVYKKEKHQRADNFTLILYPKLPQI